MAGRVQQDAFIDDSDESCPLCVEEFDLSDKNFRPCPCGYQVCQFCYNNIKNHMNGLCPACRRPYDDQSIEWKIVSPEEQKADLALQARKRAMARKKESEQRQVETLNRKNLAGIRVVQKNLVYVVGLSQKSSEEEFLRTLRGPQYFGQYGKITKIVVSKAKEGQNGNNSIGVYVTFESKEDAAKCIAAVDGSQNLDRPLRAQYGTTKYCSAFLRNETCGNRNCTFLHETGEDNDSFSRQDLSLKNALSTQRPAQQASSSRPNHQEPQPQPPPQQAPQNISAASQAIPSRSSAYDEAMSRSDSGDGSALPSSASWAAKNAHNESRRSSKPESVAASSPMVSQATTLPQAPEVRQTSTETATSNQSPTNGSVLSSLPIRSHTPEPEHPVDTMLRIVMTSNFKFTFDRSLYDADQLKQITSYPPLFDDNGGLIRYRMAKAKELERQKQEEERNVLGAISAAEEEDEAPASGSLQLGGEPETRDGPQDKPNGISAQPRSAIQPPFASSNAFPFSGPSFQASNAANLTRTLTPQQQQHLSLLRSQSSRQSPVSNNQCQGYTGGTSLHHHQQSNPFQMQNQNQAFSTAQGHQRQASRFTFANDSSSASTAVKPVANPQLMAQQSAMMPSSHGKHFQSQPVQQQGMHSNHFYSGVQGPPPGLKSSGTPPISGGGMFGQGHGFAVAMGGSAGFGKNLGTKNSNEELMRELLRTRNGSANGQVPDVGKREFKFPYVQQPMTSDVPASSLLSSLYGSQLGAHHGYQDHNLQKQKKKGKKHRHANTSSSGGGGIVDLADPSILQARMHHGATGQGQFGAQGQDSPIPQPKLIPEVTPSNPPPATATSLPSKVTAKTTPTPTPVPPGLSLPQDFPPLVAPSAPPPAPPRLQQKTTSGKAIKPVIPVLPNPAARQMATSKESLLEEPIKTADQTLTVPDSVTTESHADANTTKDMTSDIKGDSKHHAVPGETKAKTIIAPAKPTEKRQRPRKIDIAATKDASEKNLEIEDPFTEVPKAHGKGRGEGSSTISSSQPPTPGTAVSQASATSIVRQNHPRSIRVPPVPQAEVSSPGATPSSKQASRRPSLSSINQPGTPVSERISDNASFTTATISRANSPPPTKVGSAPVRQVTKSQQKKERQARAKQAEVVTKVEEPVAKAEEVQAPIVGRKKKAKREKTQGTADSTPTATRPSSPTFRDETIDDKAVPLPAPATPSKESKKVTSKAIGDVRETGSPSSPATPAINEQQKASVTAASILASLVKAGEISASAGDLFKSVPGLNHRFEGINLEPASTDDPSDDQLRLLDQGEAVSIGNGPNNPIIMLPGRRSLRGLTAEQASRYLELRKQALFNGDVPSHQALDGLIPAPPPVNVAAMSSITQRGSKTKQLINKFDTPNAPSEPSKSHGHRIAGGTFDEHLLNRRPRLSVADAEQQLLHHRKEAEMLEKKLNAVIKKNRRMLQLS